jgi:hypothetical protein
MNRKIRFLAVVFLPIFLFGCHLGVNRMGSFWHHSESQDQAVNPAYAPAASSPFKIRVTDVWNDTHEVYDVDLIGLLWSELEFSLQKRGMLWSEGMEDKYFTLEVHITNYKKGGLPERLVPWYGDTVLSVQCTLKDGDRQLATFESKRKISFGNGTFTRAAWRKVFAETSEDLINQATHKL